MSTTLTTTPICPGDKALDQLTALGIPAAHAVRWASMGPAVSATLWTYSGHALLEAHRTTSAHRTIVDACLLEGGDAETDTTESTPSWRTLIRAVLDNAPDAPLVKAVTRDEGSLFEEALRSRGFIAVGAVGSPLSIEDDTHHGHASVRGWVRWNARPQEIPAYMRQKTDFTCGPASALMALAHTSGCAPAEVSHGLRDEMELWRESTYSLGVRLGGGSCAARTKRRGSRQSRGANRWADARACGVPRSPACHPPPARGRSRSTRGSEPHRRVGPPGSTSRCAAGKQRHCARRPRGPQRRTNTPLGLRVGDRGRVRAHSRPLE